ncbi:hypothetical protein [Desnuesiella massiliensis]|nr:hypothetical protein [Desnuesiella massiliensis]
MKSKFYVSKLRMYKLKLDLEELNHHKIIQYLEVHAIETIT